MFDMHQNPDHPSGSAAEKRSSGIEERLAYYALLEEWVESGAKEACYKSSFVVKLSGT
jgi:hypothetical protein